LAVLFIAAAIHLIQKTQSNRILLATPLIAGLVLGLYVVKVGGDFMHARMVLPAVFLLLLPLFLLPVTRLLVFAVAQTAVWAAFVAHAYSVQWFDEQYAVSQDEHHGYQQFLHNTHPDNSVAYTSREQQLINTFRQWSAQGTPLLSNEALIKIPLKPGEPFDLAVVAGRLGMIGAAVPLSDQVIDTLGLANPIGAHLTVTNPGRPGHEKILNWAWILADYGDPAVVEHKWVAAGIPPAEVAAARHAMSCGALKELLDSTRQPMTSGRFWDNLTGSWDRTTLVVPADPFAAEKKFCG
jgi:arabinofuranosyltransferase